ncbi:MAG TPA: hypothetical protein VMV86_01730 [Methanosarcinales archaeon]|nr:hypothetical protein [Methanosarcinales archaeon]
MLENQVEQEVLVTPKSNQEQSTVEEQAVEKPVDSAVSQDEEGTIKVDFSKFRAEEEKPEEQPEVAAEEVTEEVVEEAEALEEITEEVQEQTEQLTDEVAEAIAEQKESGVELPENIQKVVDFMNDTGGTLQDYVKLNTDYSSLNGNQLLREYYESTRPHLDKEEIDFLMEDNFNYDEDIDEERDIRKKKIAYKEELAKAKNHLDGLKSKYYEEIKAGSRLNPDQQKAVEFFNRYNKEQETVKQEQEQQSKIFLRQTDSVFNNEFKGFDYSVGDKKYRFKVKDTTEIKNTQSNINNFVKKFLNDKNEMVDAKGYHKSLFTAMNADAVANHFYEQGKADAMKSSMAKSKNVDMDPRGTHEKVTTTNGWTIRAVPGNSVNGSKLKIKKK